MPKLKNGHEECDTCGKRYIALLAKDSCMCELVVEHVDILEINTAAVLKWRQRAKVAEALNKVMYDELELIARDKNSPPILSSTWQKSSEKWQNAWLSLTNIAQLAIDKYKETK